MEAVGPSLHMKSEAQTPGRVLSGNSHWKKPASEQQRSGAKSSFSYAAQGCFTAKSCSSGFCCSSGTTHMPPAVQIEIILSPKMKSKGTKHPLILTDSLRGNSTENTQTWAAVTFDSLL